MTSVEHALNIRKLILDDRTHSDPSYYGYHIQQLEDHGTAHISVIHPNGDAVAATNTINLL